MPLSRCCINFHVLDIWWSRIKIFKSPGPAAAAPPRRPDGSDTVAGLPDGRVAGVAIMIMIQKNVLCPPGRSRLKLPV